ncbi:MAG: AbgT family transporter, partial [Candidatus Wallbacteria bacterium]|nr:AbgT family transporter [Candidatus Wallbacteria bacterium]
MKQKNIHEPVKKDLFNLLLDFVEKTGNLLPHPVSIFILFALGTLALSFIASVLGLSAEYLKLGSAGGTETAKVVAVNLLNGEGVRKIFTQAVANFTGFAPLGTVLVAMLGVGVAEGSGLISAVLRKIVLSAPGRLVTIAVVLGGVMSNIASDAGYVVLVPLGAIVFLSFGRHPLAGLAAAFAGVSGGY